MNKAESASGLHIRPEMSETIGGFIAERDMLSSLVHGMDSPLNILFPQAVTKNIEAFRSIYRELGITGKIFFTHKPNKGFSLIRQAALAGINLDVSSEGELAHGLKAGFRPDSIEATGPKNEGYLLLCLMQGVVINTDNISEVQRLIALKAQLSSLSVKPKFMLRLSLDPDQKSRFTRNDSTFGLRVEDIAPALTSLKESGFDFIGFSFHLGSSSQQMWPDLFAHAWKMTEKAFEMGFSPRAINIGGGYPIRLAQCEVEWNAYVEALKHSVLHQEQPLSWNDSGLGFYQDEGKLKGNARFPNHAPVLTGAEALRALLTQPIAKLKNMSPANLLSEAAIDLYIEPGRALHDQAGVTLARVLETRLSSNGEQLVRLEMNRTNINAGEMPLMTDPVIVYKGERQPAPNGVFYVGNLCRHHDMIQYHRSFPEFLPETGDIVAFINTAAYMMDFAESGLLHQPTAQKIAVTRHDGKFTWQRDEIYIPLSAAA